MRRTTIILGILAALIGTAYAARYYVAVRRCDDLERDLLHATRSMRDASITQPLARQLGGDGQAAELAIRMNARGMEYYSRQLSEECGTDRAGEAIDKARDLVF